MKGTGNISVIILLLAPLNSLILKQNSTGILPFKNQASTSKNGPPEERKLYDDFSLSEPIQAMMQFDTSDYGLKERSKPRLIDVIIMNYIDAFSNDIYPI